MGKEHAQQPHQIVVLAGPNGAGKSTTAQLLLRGTLRVDQFVNADYIAYGLSPFAPHTTALQAGRLMLKRIHQLLAQGESFGFETTLAGRSHIPFFREAKSRGFFIHMVFVWLESSELAISRVADRVRQGGHDVPADTVERRYHRGIANFFRVYRQLANSWVLCDNSGGELIVVAQANTNGKSIVFDVERLNRIQRGIDYEFRIR